MRPLRMFFLLSLGLAATTVAAADRPWWQFWGGVAQDAATVAADDMAARHFTPEQRDLLRQFLQDERRSYAERERYRHGDDDDREYKDKGPKKAKPLPPGLRKKVERGGELPPGWQKKLARGEVVDGEIWSRSHRLPPDVLDRLGTLPADTEIRYLDDQVYRVMRNTREIVDILGL